MQLIHAQNITKSFNRESLFSNLNLDIMTNNLYVIRGKSGSGKSTLLNILAGLESPDNGKVLFEGTNFYSLSDKEQSKIRGKYISYVFQNFNLLPELNVRDNILLPIHINNLIIKDTELLELAERLNIKHILNQNVNLLSGGEQQRVAIARALIKKPKVLFADEPTGNLDLENSYIINDIFEELINIYEIPIIVVTHEEKLFKNAHKNFYLENHILKEV